MGPGHQVVSSTTFQHAVPDALLRAQAAAAEQLLLHPEGHDSHAKLALQGDLSFYMDSALEQVGGGEGLYRRSRAPPLACTR